MAWGKDLKIPSVEEFFKPTIELPPVEGLKVGVFGPTGIGKTDFALRETPRPVFVIDTEFGARLVAEEMSDKEKIYIMEALRLSEETYDVDPIGSLEDVENALQAILKFISENREIRGTVVIDSATDIWTWLGIWLDEEAATKFTKTGQMLRTEWGHANKRYMRMIWRLLRTKWHVIMTGKEQEVYSSKGEPTGRTKPRWQKDTVHWLDLVLKGIPEPNHHGRWTIIKCRAWGGLKGDFVDLTWSKLVDWLAMRGIKVL